MLKWIILISIVIVISFFVIKHFLTNFYLNVLIPKTPLSDNDLNFLKGKCDFTNLESVSKLSGVLFYTEVPWSSKKNNYIHDLVADHYYIIDKDHYYYINDPNRYQIVVNKDIPIKIFNSRYNNKIIFI